jgi:hypothetical protein
MNLHRQDGDPAYRRGSLSQEKARLLRFERWNSDIQKPSSDPEPTRAGTPSADDLPGSRRRWRCGSLMEATILLARRPAEADDTLLRRSLVALALRFRGARVRLLVADAEANAGTTDVRAAPPPASFDTLVLVERVKSRWTAAPPSAAVQHDDALGWLAGARGYRAGACAWTATAVAAQSAWSSP